MKNTLTFTYIVYCPLMIHAFKMTNFLKGKNPQWSWVRRKSYVAYTTFNVAK